MANVPTATRTLWLEHAQTGRRWTVPDDGSPILIGRSATAALVLSDPTCSREHARIRFDGRVAHLQPLAVTQPTFVNDVAFDRDTTLDDGDVLRCGESTLLVRLTLAELPSGAPLVRSTLETPIPAAAARVARADQTRLEPANTAHTPVDATLESAAPIVVATDIVIGRDGTVSTVVLDHPTVSRRHVALRPAGDTLTVRDLGSSNGTYVNGERVQQPRALAVGDTVRIGPFVFVWQPGRLVPQRPAVAAELRTTGLSMEVAAEGARRRLLDDVSLAIRAREFVAVIGPSGCGKSTLIRALSGRTTPTAGAVSWNGEDLHRHFEAVKREIAFVPQRETLPDLLTVRDCLTYTAHLRLPADTAGGEIDRLVREAIARVGLHEQADLAITRLSGGQRKRASLANELLVRPSLMFLDEVTSGLDEATDREMMGVFRSLADSGIAVVCVTHTLANVERGCDSLIVMARGGVVAYHGPVADARRHFGVESLGNIYEALERQPAASWRERHRASSPYQVRVAGAAGASGDGKVAPRAGVRPDGPRPDGQRPDGRRAIAQAGILTARYFATLLADRRTLAMAGVQSLVIAAFLRLVFGGEPLATAREHQLLFLLGVSAFWFGCNNAAKEIIKERPLFTLERDVNLVLPSYVLSKLVVLVAIGAAQVLLLVAPLRVAGLAIAPTGAMLGILLLTMAAGTACGLAISAAASSEDQAATTVPIALIPQILLSEAIVAPLPELARLLARATIPTYWMFRAQLQALETPGIDGVPGATMVAVFLVVFTGVAVLALWWRDRTRRA
jgi:ABC-type multidrug transport system ATPase subunit/pSer/pThr/pTyr-binding forkhead associated (FHA) protein